jgi:putative DNA primase/helicase
MQPIIEIRLAMVSCGYTPIPVIGKIPPLEKWPEVTNVSRSILEDWDRDWPNASNTGILTRHTPTIDLDLLNEPAALAAEKLIRERFDGLGCVLTRIGRAPKRAIPFRTKAPFKKLTTNFVVAVGAGSEKIEFLGDGQQFVAHGIHPDTRGEYSWTGGDPTTISYRDLPEIIAEEARQLQIDIVVMLVRDFGYVTTQGAPKKKSTNRAKTARKNPKRDQAWAEAALDAECAAITTTAAGDRNDQLNKSAYNIYQIVHGNPGLLDENEVRRRLFAAAEACGLVDDDGADSAWRTIESGEAGAEKQPRVRPLAKLEQPAPASGGGLGLAGAAPGFGSVGVGVGGGVGVGVTASATQPGMRRIIQLIEGDYHVAVDEAEEALTDAEWTEIYQRGGILVRPVLEEMAAAKDRATSAWKLVEVQPPYLMEMLGRVATFTVYDKRSKAWLPRNCPKDIGNTLLARQGHWQAQIVLGVVHTPQFRHDGSLTMMEGYDPGSRLLFKPDGEIFPPIPDRPTKEQAQAALKLLEDPIAMFPFKSPVDKAVVLSMFLTGLCRRILDFAPLHGMSATAAGTGKSLLVDLASILISGREAPVISIDSSREEVEKRLGSSLLAGDTIIAFDNCNAPVNSPLICSTLTQRWVRVRILGLSRQADTPTSVLLTATGNNLILEGDLTRRSVRCELDAKVERPELREFAINPKTVFRQRRGELVSAALTILRAGRVAGLAPISPPLGGFEMWSSWVRNPLQWLGCADPCDSMEQLYQGDPEREAHEVMIVIWRDHFGLDVEFHAQQLIERSLLNQELRTALLNVAQERNSSGVISTKRLGQWLKKVDGKICQGLCIRRSRVLAGYVLWKLTSV